MRTGYFLTSKRGNGDIDMKKFERYTTECEAAYIRDNSYELLCEHFKYVGIHGVHRSGSIELSFEVGPSEDRTVFIKTENWLVKHPNDHTLFLGTKSFANFTDTSSQRR